MTKTNATAIVVDPAPYFKEYMICINGNWHWVRHISGQGAYTRKNGVTREYGVAHQFEISQCAEEKLPRLVRQFIAKHMRDGKARARFLAITDAKLAPRGTKGGWNKCE